MSLRSLLFVIVVSTTISINCAIVTNNSPVSLIKKEKSDKSAFGLKVNAERAQKEVELLDTVATALPSRVPSKDTTGPWYFSVFPIYPQELKKFFSLSFMMFWIVFVFTMTRDTKDALIVTNCGAEAIAFLKVYGVVPAAATFMVVYAKLANTLSPRSLFYVTLIPFFIFYAVFAFVLYPLRDVLHPLSIKVPEGGLSFAVNLFRHWTFSLYYIVTELWGSAGIPLLFWSCANDVIQIDQAKRLYPLIALIGNLGPILSGIAMTKVTKGVSKIYLNDEIAFEKSLKILTTMMCSAGTLVTFLHWFIHHLTDTEKKEKREFLLSTKEGRKKLEKSEKIENENQKIISKKKKLNFFESLKVLAADKYLRNIATMVLSYGITMEFTEIIWKSSVKKLFPIKSDYLKFNGQYSTLVGIFSFFMMFVGAKVVDVMGWRAGAMMTPLMMGLLALPFFASIIIGGTSSPKALKIAVYVGLVQNVLSKATKYAIFDPTKEMTYIPLDQDGKTKGKAAIDVLGARLGKSGGALAQQVLVLFCGSIMSGAPILAVLFYITIFSWISSITSLTPMFKERTTLMEAKLAEKNK